MSNFISVQYVPTPDPNDEALSAARARDDAARLNPDQRKIAFDALSPEQRDAAWKEALSGSRGATRLETQPDGSTVRTEHGVVRYSPEEPLPGVEGVLASIRSSGAGIKRASWNGVQGSDIVTLPNGATVRVEIAAKVAGSGIVRNADGTFTAAGSKDASADVSAAVGSKKDGADSSAGSPIVDFHSDGMKQVFSNLVEMSGSEKAAHSVAASVISHGIDGDVESAAAVITQRFGHDPEEAAREAASLIEDGKRSAAKHLTEKYGIDGNAALQYAGETLPAARRASLAYRVWRGDRSAFQEIADHFRRGVRMASVAAAQTIR